VQALVGHGTWHGAALWCLPSTDPRRPPGCRDRPSGSHALTGHTPSRRCGVRLAHASETSPAVDRSARPTQALRAGCRRGRCPPGSPLRGDALPRQRDRADARGPGVSGLRLRRWSRGAACRGPLHCQLNGPEPHSRTTSVRPSWRGTASFRVRWSASEALILAPFPSLASAFTPLERSRWQR